MKLRLVGLYAGFTGDYGVLQFVDGLSVTDVSANDGRRMGGLVTCETEDGKHPLYDTVQWDNYGVLLSVDPVQTRLITVAEEARINAGAVIYDAFAAAPPDTGSTEFDPPVVHTRESLEAIADSEGIAGLRKIADPLGLKSTSIQKLINELLSGKSVSDDSPPNHDVETKV